MTLNIYIFDLHGDFATSDGISDGVVSFWGHCSLPAQSCYLKQPSSHTPCLAHFRVSMDLSYGFTQTAVVREQNPSAPQGFVKEAWSCDRDAWTEGYSCGLTAVMHPSTAGATETLPWL